MPAAMSDIQLELFSQAAPEPAYLFFDTETTGLPRSWQAPVTALDNWPRMVQLAYMAYDGEGNRVDNITDFGRTAVCVARRWPAPQRYI